MKGNVKIKYMLNMCSQFYRKCDVKKPKTIQNLRTVVQNEHYNQTTMNCDCKPKEEDEEIRRQMSRRPR